MLFEVLQNIIPGMKHAVQSAVNQWYPHQLRKIKVVLNSIYDFPSQLVHLESVRRVDVINSGMRQQGVARHSYRHSRYSSGWQIALSPFRPGSFSYHHNVSAKCKLLLEDKGDGLLHQ